MRWLSFAGSLNLQVVLTKETKELYFQRYFWKHKPDTWLSSTASAGNTLFSK